jgi:WD40 repeat protein
MSASLDCPGMERWPALLAASLPREQREQLERHLETCPSCQQRLDQAEECHDELLQLARCVGDPTATPHDPALVQALERLRETKGAAPAVEAADLYFLGPSDRPSALGTLGGYEVREVIGQGGMGVVLKAYEPALNRFVAIKVLAAAVAGSATARRRFTREAQAAAAVCHDHVVAVHGVHDVEGLPYLVMQYIAGESLEERLDRTGPLAVEEVVRIGMQAASGLAAAHAQGLIHRDIKPANLLLEDGLARVKITDFGLARMADDVGLTRDGVVSGTPEYMAPEQARGEPVDHRADLYSLGSVLYAMSTGRPPFRGASPLALLRQVNEQQPTPPRSLNADVPAWLEDLIARLMAKDPADRFQSAAEVAALLEGYLAHLRQPATVAAPQLPPSSPASAGRPGARMSGHPWRPLLPLIALAVCLPIALAAWGLAGAGGPADKSKPEVPAADKLKAEFHQDFRTIDLDDQQALRTVGSEIHRDDKGVRITLPAGQGILPHTGFVTNFTVRGDFDMTLAYEVLKEETPTKGYGVGLAMLAQPEDAGKPGCAVGRRLKTNGQVVFTGARKAMPSSSTVGRLCLRRVGPVIHFLAADGDSSPLIEFDTLEVGTGDVQWVRLAGTAGESESALDARLLDFTVRAEQLPGLAGADGSPRSHALTWIVLAAVIVLSLGLGLTAWRGRRVWQRLERLVAARAGGKPAPEAVSKPVVFACPACGKKLRAGPALAGKQCKCPGCGGMVPVPPGAVAASPAAVAGRRSPRRRLLVSLLLLTALASGLGLLTLVLLSPGGQADARHDATPPPAPADSGIDEQVLALAFTPDGKKLVTAGARFTLPGQFMVWDVATGKELVRVRGMAGIRGVAVSPDGQTVACGAFGGTLTLRDVATGQARAEATGHSIGVNAVAFSPDGKMLATAGLDRVVKLWDAKDLGERKALVGHTDMVFSVAFYGDGRSVVSGAQDRTARVWDVATGEQKLTLLGHMSAIEQVAVSPADGTLATGSWDRTVKLWDPATGTERATLRGHDGGVVGLAFSLDGKFLASASDRGTVYVWDVASRQLVHTWKGQGQPVWSLAFSPDGKLLASGGSDKIARLWDVAADREAATLSTVAAPGTPYTPDTPVRGKGWLAAAGIIALVIALCAVGAWWLARLPKPAKTAS